MIDFFCYAILQSGQVLNLERLCQSSGYRVAIADSKQQHTDDELKSIAAQAFANEYCAARQSGWGDIDAKKAGNRAASSWLIQSPNANKLIDPEYFTTRERRVSSLCPEFSIN